MFEKCEKLSKYTTFSRQTKPQKSMKEIGDYIDNNPISSIFAVMYIIFFVWIAIEFYNAKPYDGDDF